MQTHYQLVIVPKDLGLRLNSAAIFTHVINKHFILEPWQFFLLVMSSWINRQQQEVIEYPRTENQVLKEKLEATLTTRF